MILISHNFDQVLRIADDVFVMRSGRTVAHRPTRVRRARSWSSLVTGATVDAIVSEHHHTDEPEGTT